MISIPLAPFLIWIMVFMRVIAVITFFPLFGENFIPLRVRVLMAAVIAIALCPVAPVSAAMFPASIPGFIRLVLTETLLGFGLGLIGKILFAIVQFSGQLAGEQMGFGIVNAIDPTGSHQVSVVAEMLYVMSILIFLTSGIHRAFISVLAQSFSTLPRAAPRSARTSCGS